MGTIADNDVVIVEAARSPLARRNGGLATVHPVELLGAVQRAVVERSGIDPALVGQVIGGCVSQVGEQTFNIARNAWLSAGLPLEVAGSTIDAQCGSSQQATNLAAALVKSGVVDVAIACGVESMSRVPLGAATRGEFGRPTTASYREHYELTSQFEGAERIADKWGITRADADAFGLESQVRAQTPLGRRSLRPRDRSDRGSRRDRGRVARGHHPRRRARRGAARDVARSVGQAQARRARERRAHRRHVVADHRRRGRGAALHGGPRPELGLRVRARIVDQCLVGVDPVLMLTGPIDATRRLLDRTGLTIDDLDVIEINEAFASVVLAWEREVKPDMARANINGGAIALGHPVGATGARLLTTALHELERSGTERALVTMCCGGGLGTGTILERG